MALHKAVRVALCCTATSRLRGRIRIVKTYLGSDAADAEKTKDRMRAGQGTLLQAGSEQATSMASWMQCRSRTSTACLDCDRMRRSAPKGLRLAESGQGAMFHPRSRLLPALLTVVCCAAEMTPRGYQQLALNTLPSIMHVCEEDVLNAAVTFQRSRPRSHRSWDEKRPKTA